MLSGVDSELLGFSEPWLAREPRLLLACQFAPEGIDRGRFLAAQVLARELAQTLLAISERRVAEARLMWWSDEASYWLQGHPRHPLALGLDASRAAPTLAQLVHQTHAWMDAPPDTLAALQRQVSEFARLGASLANAADSGGWGTAWLAMAVRLALGEGASGASLLPLDLCARHGLRRSQWAELDMARRRGLLAETVRGMVEPACASGAGPAALHALERRWLARMHGTADDRLRILDVFAAWRSARRGR